MSINYFTHDVNARSDDKLSAIKTKYGLIGYAIYFILLEIMSKAGMISG